MLLMSVVSVWAEESSETIPMAQRKVSYSGDHFEISGDAFSSTWGLRIDGDNRIAISAKNGERITKIEYFISTAGEDEDESKVRATEGVVDDINYFINDVNASSLEIYSENVSADLTIQELTIYYTQNNDPIEDEYVQTEIFTTTQGNEFTGNNINVTGVQGSNGLYINSTNGITISAKDNSSVQISRVDLTFSSDVNGESLTSSAGGAIDGSGSSWSISNINSSSTTILLSSGSGYVNNIKVYYVEVPEESGDKTVSFVTKAGLNYSKENINVTATNNPGRGLRIDNGGRITIASDEGVEILKVDLHFNVYYPNTDKQIKSNVGTISGSGYEWSVNNVNSTSLTISHPGEGNWQVQIDSIAVHYRERLAPSTIEVAARKAEVAYWSTFYSGIANYQAPEGTHVYKVNYADNSITMTEIEDRIVTKGQGVVLKNCTTSNLNTINIVMTRTDSESSDDYSGNSLKGTGVAITNPGNAYVLNYKSTSGVGFYKLSSTGTIPANRAYLLSDGIVAAAREFFALDAAVTGIDDVNAQDSENDVKTFDLQGRRVANPAKGVYIVNGKKVIMK